MYAVEDLCFADSQRLWAARGDGPAGDRLEPAREIQRFLRTARPWCLRVLWLSTSKNPNSYAVGFTNCDRKKTRRWL